MTNKEFFISRWEMEQPKFVSVLRALPPSELKYAPHGKSKAAGDLAWQLAEEQRALAGLFATGEIHYDERPRPDTVDEIVAAYEEQTTALRNGLMAEGDHAWEGPTKFFMGGQVVAESTVDDMCWGFLFDMIHHRGQLSTYLRPMGGKVPAIYGPSADDHG